MTRIKTDTQGIDVEQLLTDAGWECGRITHTNDEYFTIRFHKGGRAVDVDTIERARELAGVL